MCQEPLGEALKFTNVRLSFVTWNITEIEGPSSHVRYKSEGQYYKCGNIPSDYMYINGS